MRKITGSLLVAALMTMTTSRLRAGDKEWAPVGKVPTDVTTASVIAKTVSHPHHHTVYRDICYPPTKRVVSPPPRAIV
ncbi:MAG: hypothetical protein M2R45_03923 [Verrucomicrobia subdivision 3 bacterium]|nr:hypothetical protein [Limisphaerales bacterium]MCS1417497.1 hypothetical protein [Limisphaerales bacterium]